MHCHAEVYVSPDVDFPDIEEAVDKIMAPYSEHIPGPTVKEYLTEKEVESMREYYESKPKTPAELIIGVDLKEKINDWEGMDAGHDAGGFFRISTYNETAFYDWYRVGGRWSGEKDEGYSPEDDPENHETCFHCQGTGFRKDAIGEEARKENSSYTCNGCGMFDPETKKWKHGVLGAGKRLKWPTGYTIAADSNILPLDKVSDELTSFALIVNGEVFRQEQWVRGVGDETGSFQNLSGYDGFAKKKLDQLGVTDGWLVTVDYHS